MQREASLPGWKLIPQKAYRAVAIVDVAGMLINYHTFVAGPPELIMRS